MVTMHSALLTGLLLTQAPANVLADTISNPTVNGQAVDHCPVINGTTDCRREMIAASAVCKEYGFRKANFFQLRQINAKGLQLTLSIDNQESVFHSEWRPDRLDAAFETIDCSK